MNTEQPETLAEIVAQMRRWAKEGATLVNTGYIADRIEAAAEREREKAKDLSKELDGNRAITGNAAALREALEKIRHEYGWGRIGCRTCVSSEADVERVCDLFEKQIDAALAAPARNCDRFATAEEAVAAFADHLRAWENAHGIYSEYPDHAVQVPAGAFAWLFAPAEGGDHA